MENNKGFAHLLLVIALLAVGIGVIYLSSNNPFDNTSDAPAENAALTETSDPTDDWKTYTNEEYGFSFKYPRSTDTTLEETVDGEDYLKINENVNFLITPFSIEECDGLCPIIDEKTNQTINQIEFNKYITTSPEDIAFSDKLPGQIILEYKLDDGKVLQWNFGLSNKNNTMEVDSAENVSNQILSTFEFTENE